MGIEDSPTSTRVQTRHNQDEATRVRESLQTLPEGVQRHLRKLGRRHPRASLAFFDGNLFPDRNTLEGRKKIK